MWEEEISSKLQDYPDRQVSSAGVCTPTCSGTVIRDLFFQMRYFKNEWYWDSLRLLPWHQSSVRKPENALRPVDYRDQHIPWSATLDLSKNYLTLTLPDVMMLDFNDADIAFDSAALRKLLAQTQMSWAVFRTDRGWHAFCLTRRWEADDTKTLRFMQDLCVNNAYIVRSFYTGFSMRLNSKEGQNDFVASPGKPAGNSNSSAPTAAWNLQSQVWQKVLPLRDLPADRKQWLFNPGTEQEELLRWVRFYWFAVQVFRPLQGKAILPLLCDVMDKSIGKESVPVFNAFVSDMKTLAEHAEVSGPIVRPAAELASPPSSPVRGEEEESWPVPSPRVSEPPAPLRAYFT